MGLIPEEIITQVLERCDIVETIAGYIPLKRAGRNYKALCPFHNEKTPSFVVGTDKQIFHCFGCGTGGNVISFVMKQERIDFPEAVQILAQRAGISIPEDHPHRAQAQNFQQKLFDINHLTAQFFHTQLLSAVDPAAKAARKYLKDRQISLEAVKRCELGLAPDSWDRLLDFLRAKDISLNLMEKAGVIVPRENREGYYDRFRHRIIFPIFDVRARCLGFGARALNGDQGAKYINSPETAVYTKGQHLFGLHLTREAIRQKDEVIVVEGYLDFIIPFQAGVGNIVASLGTALTVEQIRLLRRYTQNVIMLFDADNAGQEATLRSLDLLIAEDMNVRVATLDSGDDPDSFVRKRGIEEFHNRVYQALSLFDYKLKILMNRYSYKTVEGKAMICAQILPTIRKFRSAIVKFGYIRQLAETLSVTEEALLLELQNHTEPSRSRPAAVHPGRSGISSDNSRTVELKLLKLMLEEQVHIPFVRSELELSDFHDEKIKAVVSRVFEMSQQGLSMNTAHLMHYFDDMRISEMLSHLVMTDHWFAVDQEKLRRDYIDRIKRDRLKFKRQELSHQIRLAEISGDHQRLEDLKHRFNQLLKG